MLCIVFSKKRMIAGAKLKQTELIPLNGEKFTQLRNQPIAKVLQQHLGEITSIYTDMRKKSGLQPQPKVPTSITLPVDPDMNEKLDSKSELLSVFNSQQARKNQLIHIDYTPLSFFYGLDAHLKISGEPCIILEALDDYLNVCYYNLDEIKERENLKDPEMLKGLPFQNARYMNAGLFNFLPLKNVGMSSGLMNLIKESEQEFIQNGLRIDDIDKQEIHKQIHKGGKARTITLQKTSGPVSILAELRISAQRYDESLAVNKNYLANRISHAKLDQLGIKHVLLLGEFLKNDVLKDYFNKELRIGSKVFQLDNKLEEAEFHVIINGLTLRTNEILKAKAEEERRKREEEERRRREEEERRRREAERKAQIARDTMLQEIRNLCNDPDRKKEYEQKYIPKGIKLGIPKEVLSWTIQEAIKSATLDIAEKPIYSNTNNPVENISKDTPVNQGSSPVNGLKGVPEKMTVQNESNPYYQSNVSPSGNGSKVEGSASNLTSKQSIVTNPHVKKTDGVNGENGSDLKSYRREAHEKSSSEKASTSEILSRLTSEKQVKPPLNRTDGTFKQQEVSNKTSNGDNANKVKNPSTSSSEKKDSPLRDTKTPTASSNPESRTQEDKNGVKDITKETSNKIGEKKGKDVLDSNTSIEEMFEIEGVLLDPEFITKKAIHIVTHDTKVVKILPRSEMSNPERVAAFENLFQKELAYYQELSEISEAKEGKYYYRDYVERNTLRDYVKKVGLDKKDHFDKLTSNDLKLILEVWREIKGLNVSHANLSEYNILVISKRKWNLQRETEIRLVGFTSADCTVKEMEEQVHKIWAKLIGADIYLDFRKKFKI